MVDCLFMKVKTKKEASQIFFIGWDHPSLHVVKTDHLGM